MSASESERPSEVHSLHFDLPGVAAETPFTFHVALREYPIEAHSESTRNEAREGNRFLRALPDSAITHRAEIAMPADAVALAYVTRPVVVDGFATSQIVSMAIHVPRETRLRDVRRGHLPHANRLHPKLRRHRLRANLLHSDLLELDNAPDAVADFHDAYETAVALLFHHPELVSISPGKI